MENNLEKILKENINEKKYGDFSEILKEIFRRRAIEYEFSDEHMESEIKRFLKNVKKIDLVQLNNKRFILKNFENKYVFRILL